MAGDGESDRGGVKIARETLGGENGLPLEEIPFTFVMNEGNQISDGESVQMQEGKVVEVVCSRVTGCFQYQQLGKVFLEGNAGGCDRMQELCVPLQIRFGAVNGFPDGVADSLNDPLLVIEDNATHAKRSGCEDILCFVVDKYNRARVNCDVVEDMPVKPEVGFSVAGVRRSVDLVKQRPVCWLCPEIIIIRLGDVRHGIYSELAVRLTLQLANKGEHLIVW